MDDVVRCPGCDANLTLPSLPAGETVQCPRCQRVFQSGRQSPIRRADTHPVTTTATPSDELTEEIDLGPRWRPNEPLRGTWMAYIAIAFVGFGALTFVNDIWVQVKFVALTSKQQQAGEPRQLILKRIGPADPRLALEFQWQRWDEYAHTSKVLHRFANVLAMVAFLIWIWQAHSNLPRLNALGVSYSPRWAVLCWFIPLGNLVAPFSVLQEIWRGSHPNAVADPMAWRETPFANSIRWWCLCYFGAWFLVGVRMFLGLTFAEEPFDFKIRALVWVAFDVCVAAAGVMIIYVIHTVTRRQMARLEGLQNL